MPIRDLSYQRWSGAPNPRGPVSVLARDQLRILLRRRAVRLLLLVSALFTLAWGGMIYLESGLPLTGALREVARAVEVDARSFQRFLTMQRLVHLLLFLAAADLIALDRRHRALQIYLARPLGPSEYVLAKGIAVAVLLSAATWAPALFLVVLKTALGADVRWLGEQPWLAGSIAAYSLALIVPLTLLTLAISSLSASPRLAGAQLFGFVALSGAAAQVLAHVTRSPAWHLLSLNDDLDQAASWLFGAPPRFEVPAWTALVALAGVGAASVLVLRARVRAIDVVGGS